MGEKIKEFEFHLEQICNVKNAIAVVNGTAALHALLVSLGIGVDDEVLCPSLTFVGTANAIALAGAIPHFVDCRSNDFTVDPQMLADYLSEIGELRRGHLYNKFSGKRIHAFVLVHVFGHPGAVIKLKEIAKRYGLFFIEDAAESLGTLYENKPVGSHGIAGILSFNGNKIITTGGGGAILTNDDTLATKIRHLTTTAKRQHRWKFYHDSTAFNYRMPNINAALGLAQLKKLSKAIDKKRQLAEIYHGAFSNARYWTFVEELAESRCNYWLNAVKLIQPDSEVLYETLDCLVEKGIHVRPVWQPMHLLPMYQRCPRSDLSVTEKLSQQTINLPSSPQLVDVING